MIHINSSSILHGPICLCLAIFSLSVSAGTAPGLDYIENCEKKLLIDHPRVANPLDPTAPNPQILDLKKILDVEIIGQSNGISHVLNTIEVAQAMIQDPNKPLSRMLLTGPTGVGKTETFRALVKALGGDPDRHLIRIDCGELQEGHTTSRLIGATASFVGYDDKPMLHPQILKDLKLPLPLADGTVRMINVILIDEIEKCHDNVFKLLLGILDNGKVTMGNNTESYVRDAIIGATSNLGAEEVEALIREKAEKFKNQDPEKLTAEERDLTGRIDFELKGKFAQSHQTAIKRRFTPEFRNRWQAIIQYLHLSHDEYLHILQKLSERIQRRIFDAALRKVGFVLTPSAREYLVREGTNITDGARPLDNLLMLKVRNPLARLMVTGQIQSGDILIGDHKEGQGEIFWRVAAEGLDEAELKAFAVEAYPGYGFENYDWNAAKAGPAIRGSLVQALNGGYENVIRNLYRLTDVSPTSLGVKVGESSKEINVKYAMIDEKLVRIENHGNSFAIKEVEEIPDGIKQKYKNIQIFTGHAVEEMVKRSDQGKL